MVAAEVEAAEEKGQEKEEVSMSIVVEKRIEFALLKLLETVEKILALLQKEKGDTERRHK